MAHITFEDQLHAIVSREIKNSIEKIALEIREKAVDELRSSIGKIVAGVAINTEQYISIQRNERGLVIEVKLDKGAQS